MHGYHTDDEIRKRVFILAFGLSILLAYLFYWIALKAKIPWWVDAPSVLGFFGILLWVYDNYLWKLPFLRKIPWFYIPDLNGKWNAEIKSSYQNFETSVKARATIRQTAVKMSIGLETETSSSHSTTASLLKIDGANKYELIYHYINEPKADSVNTMNIHHGTSCMEFSTTDMIEGDYFSGRGRVNYGKITFEKE
jgi:hypothetical protein